MPQNLFIVSGPVIVENNALLVTKHGDDLFWKFPGGRATDFETNLRDTARREAKEEVGVELTLEAQEPFFLYIQKPGADSGVDVLLVHFLAKRSGEIHIGSDIREFAWLPINNLPEDIAPNIKPTLAHFGFLHV